MSRKDYILLAQALADTREASADVLGSYSVLRLAAVRIADTLAADNPRFNYWRFLSAAGFAPDDNPDYGEGDTNTPEDRAFDARIAEDDEVDS
ncbi:MAG: hypothetical protein KGL39_29765 [Patescibacteria group bacterium]|nr:hypothetical protein [Patescibacteria group bacterium]